MPAPSFFIHFCGFSHHRFPVLRSISSVFFLHVHPEKKKPIDYAKKTEAQAAIKHNIKQTKSYFIIILIFYSYLILC